MKGIQKIWDACKNLCTDDPEYTVHREDIMVKFTALRNAKVLDSKVLNVTKDVAIEMEISTLIKKMHLYEYFLYSYVPLPDGNGRMSRLLTLLLLYKNGYSVGKYISIERQIEKTKDRYYDVLETSNIGWHEEKNDPTPFIRYMLTVILACYTRLEERVGIISGNGNTSSAYDIVKKYTEEKIGKFTGADVVAHCPSIGRSSVLAALKKLVDERSIIRYGSGRSTYYVKADRQ